MITQTQYNDIVNGTPHVIMPDGQSGRWQDLCPGDHVNIIPGSFNPLHYGHILLFEKAITNRFFEISLNRFNKQNYSLDDINKIIKQFQWKFPVVITNALLFKDKTKQLNICNQFFPNVNIHYYIGDDVYNKILEISPDDLKIGLSHSFRVFSRDNLFRTDPYNQCVSFRSFHFMNKCNLRSSDLERIV